MNAVFNMSSSCVIVSTLYHSLSCCVKISVLNEELIMGKIRDCYKKRVEDDEMVFIGEAEIARDGTWEVYMYFPTRSYLPEYTPSLYYPEFYIEEDDYEVIKADDTAYESQLYISPPIDKDNLPYVTALINIYDWCDENDKWDGIKKDYFYYIDKFKNDRLVQLKLEIAEDSRYE